MISLVNGKMLFLWMAARSSNSNNSSTYNKKQEQRSPARSQTLSICIQMCLSVESSLVNCTTVVPHFIYNNISHFACKIFVHKFSDSSSYCVPQKLKRIYIEKKERRGLVEWCYCWLHTLKTKKSSFGPLAAVFASQYLIVYRLFKHTLMIKCDRKLKGCWFFGQFINFHLV